MQARSSNAVSGLVDVVRALYRDLLRDVDAPICFFGVYEPAAQRVHVVWQVQDGVELPGGAFPLGSGLTSQVIRERRARLVQDWERQGPAVKVQYATDQPELPRSAITVPVVVDEQVLGVLSLQSSRAGAFGTNDLEVVQRLVEGAAPAIAGLLGVRPVQSQRAGTFGVDDVEAAAQRLVDGAAPTSTGLPGATAEGNDASAGSLEAAAGQDEAMQGLREASAGHDEAARALDSEAALALESEAALALDSEAALALDNEARLVRLSHGARTLLSLQDHSVVFGFPIDQQQAGQWPLGSATLGKSLRSVFDLVQRGEAVAEADIPATGDTAHLLRCRASALIEAGRPAGAVLTLSPIDTAA